MPGIGPPPKENRRRVNADTFGGTRSIVDDGERCGQPLGGVWSKPVLDWWETWRRSPQAKLFVDTDWQRLRMLAPLVASYWECPDRQVLAEIRQNETLLGATHLDRLRARMKVDKPGAAEVPAGVAALDEYRRNLAG
jgi:hypothetical protein